MSTWFNQKVTAIGQPKDLAKLINVNLGELIDRLHLSAGMENAPPFPLLKMSKQHKNIIFASSTLVECNSLYRFLLFNSKHIDIITIPEMNKYSQFKPHDTWVSRLEYNSVLEKFFPDYYDDTPDITVAPINYT